MSVSIHNAVRRMADCYNSLRRSKLTVDDLSVASGAMAGETKRHIVHALESLNDKSTIRDAFKVTLFTYLLLEGRPDILQQSEGSSEGAAATAAMEFFAPLWATVGKQPYLLDAFTAKVVSQRRGDRALSGVQAKQIGEVLRYVREQRTLHPESTRETMLGKIKERFGSPHSSTLPL
ncbi:uncharacterized protein LOC126767121 [Bactrocera neohumeralis]|uniref:uncharacterized protein LOC126767121 n=1 Tax=Bactrocera neohumeralis TaxID=98809 RepID=UPI0021659EF7|nr:uncharacterized protein LOC126767121 [Bactrocera neohumeralis]